MYGLALIRRGIAWGTQSVVLALLGLWRRQFSTSTAKSFAEGKDSALTLGLIWFNTKLFLHGVGDRILEFRPDQRSVRENIVRGESKDTHGRRGRAQNEEDCRIDVKQARVLAAGDGSDTKTTKQEAHATRDQNIETELSREIVLQRIFDSLRHSLLINFVTADDNSANSKAGKANDHEDQIKNEEQEPRTNLLDIQFFDYCLKKYGSLEHEKFLSHLALKSKPFLT